MKIIISPAKKMKEGVDFADAVSLPRYLDKTQQLLDHLKALNHDELKQCWLAAMPSRCRMKSVLRR